MWNCMGHLWDLWELGGRRDICEHLGGGDRWELQEVYGSCVRYVGIIRGMGWEE